MFQKTMFIFAYISEYHGYVKIAVFQFFTHIIYLLPLVSNLSTSVNLLGKNPYIAVDSRLMGYDCRKLKEE